MTSLNQNTLWAFWSTFTFSLLSVNATDSLDAIILKDMLPSTGSKCNMNAQSMPQTQSTSFTFEHQVSPSYWAANSPALEPDLFLAEMSHQDTASQNKSWTFRIGQGGNIYSLRGAFGESVPPQINNEFVDEVYQSVSVNQDKNRNSGKTYFIHQAGTYSGDGEYTSNPFFTPNIAYHCSGNECSFASWGQQPSVPTFHRSDMLYFSSYTDCGDGVIEFNTVMHNDGDVDAVTYLNVPWGGTRQSNLRDHYRYHVPSGGQQLVFPGRWFGGNGINIETTDGHFTFAQHVLVPEDQYTSSPLQVPHNNRFVIKGEPSSYHKPDHSATYGVYCMEVHVEPVVTDGSGCRDCNIWFQNSRTQEIIHTHIVIHWAWEGHRLFFCPTDITSDEFRLRWLKGDEMIPMEANNGMPFEDNLALTFVHGTQAPLPERWATSRARYGKSGSVKRDFNVYTLNTRVNVNPGDTYMYQQYVIAGELPNNLASAPSWVDEVYEDVYHEGDMTGTEIHLYSNDENTFGGYVAGGSSCLQGVSRCTGKSVPEFGLRPLFAITCGANKYVGSDRYHFAPPRANETETIRPYACDGELPSVRPTWKLLGFFPEGSCDFLIGASYDKDFCATSLPPTMNPTSIPSNSPTVKASASPSVEASISPSIQASVLPSIKASASPSIQASASPSIKASASPSIKASASPSVEASASPSIQASASPSVEASASPSIKASASPSVEASASPSIQASASPSIKASASPSIKASASPSVEASASPSIQASASPSIKASASPFIQASASPSIKASASPSIKASASPSIKASLTPSSEPTIPTKKGNGGGGGGGKDKPKGKSLYNFLTAFIGDCD